MIIIKKQLYNETTVNELALYIINDRAIYRNNTLLVCHSLACKIARGKYDPDKAPKAFEYVAEVGAKKYHAECSDSSKWYQIFSLADRREVAVRLLEEYEDYIRELTEEVK